MSSSTNSKKVIVVTGASSGFGRIAVESLARHGHTVFAGLRGVTARNKPAADELTALAAKEQLQLFPIELDVVSETSVNDAAKAIKAKAGRVDVVINNAGVYKGGLTEAHTADDIREVFEVNVIGVQNVNRAFLPLLREVKQGLVLYTSSVVGRSVFPGGSVYAASKHALEALIEGYRLEGAAHNIAHVSIQPGPFKTDIFGKASKASDPSRDAAYAEVSKTIGEVGAKFVSLVSDPNWQKPEEVSDAFIDVIEGKVVAKSIVVDRFGEPFRTANKNFETLQHNVLTSFGASALLKA